jgi:hypothetical protein
MNCIQYTFYFISPWVSTDIQHVNISEADSTSHVRTHCSGKIQSIWGIFFGYDRFVGPLIFSHNLTKHEWVAVIIIQFSVFLFHLPYHHSIDGRRRTRNLSLFPQKIHVSKKNHVKNHVSKKSRLKKITFQKNHVSKKIHVSQKNHVSKVKYLQLLKATTPKCHF